MDAESKGKAWFGKIVNKLERIIVELVEADTYTSQNTRAPSSGTCNVQQRHVRFTLPSSESPSEPSSHQNFEISGNVLVQGDSLKENLSTSSLPDENMLSSSPLLEEYCDSNLTPATTLGDKEPIITNEETQVTNTLILSAGDLLVSSGEEMAEEGRVESCIDVVSTEPPSTQSSLESLGTAVEYKVPAPCGISTDDINLNPVDTKILHVPVQDNEANMRSSDVGKILDVSNSKSDVAPLDTNPLQDMAFREDPSYVDENALYAVRVRIKKLRSFKRKILDALTSKRRREEEYEQLAIWFGDADMGSDLAMDSKSSELEPEDSQWELL